MTAQLVLATRNAHKLDELAEILGAAGVDVRLLPLPDGAPDVVEDGLTFADNALKKARASAAHTGLPSVADDSGLCVDVLNGMPGIFSARWAGTGRDDSANLALVLDQVADVPDDHLGARFVCAAAVALPSGEERVVEGEVLGRLVRTPRGAGGFGYDPIFVRHGYDVTTAEMTAEAKHAISHRGNAFRALAPVLGELLVP
jgi:XTP/dITP diphosphohydrolase